MASLSHYMSSDALSANGLLVGRVWNPAAEGPSVVRRDGEALYDTEPQLRYSDRRAGREADIDIDEVLALLRFEYASRFFGRDILATPRGTERALIATYERLGLLSRDFLTVRERQLHGMTYLQMVRADVHQ